MIHQDYLMYVIYQAMFQDQNGPARVSGSISAPTGFGLGVEPDKDLLGKPEF